MRKESVKKSNMRVSICESDREEKPEENKLKKLTKYGYGTGHIINDMSGSLWFSLLLLYYVDVIKIGGIYAGIIMSVGQVASGLSTIAVGILVEKKTPFRIWTNYGKRKVN